VVAGSGRAGIKKWRRWKSRWPWRAAKSTQGADEAREQLAMLAAQVGTMQGQLGRLNALGERLTEKADLDPEEFNFKELPPWAASYDADLEVSLNELQDSEHLSQQLSRRRLSVLESFIMNHHITDAGFISEHRSSRSGFGSPLALVAGRSVQRSRQDAQGVDFVASPAPPFWRRAGVVSWAGRHPELATWWRSTTAMVGDPLYPQLQVAGQWAPWSMRARKLP
jgi:hypothetical protein